MPKLKFICPECGCKQLLTTMPAYHCYKVKEITDDGRIVRNKKPHWVELDPGHDFAPDFSCAQCHKKIAEDEDELLEYLRESGGDH